MGDTKKPQITPPPTTQKRTHDAELPPVHQSRPMPPVKPPKKN